MDDSEVDCCDGNESETCVLTLEKVTKQNPPVLVFGASDSMVLPSLYGCIWGISCYCNGLFLGITVCGFSLISFYKSLEDTLNFQKFVIKKISIYHYNNIMSYSILSKVVAIIFQLLAVYAFCGEFLALRHIKPIVEINGQVSKSSSLHVNFDGDVQSVNVICGDDDNVMVRHQRSRTIDLQHSSVHMTKEDFIPGNYTCGQNGISVSISRTPTFKIQTSALIRANKSDTITIPCGLTTYSNDEYTLHWYKDGDRLNATRRSRGRNGVLNCDLVLDNVCLNDTGSYQCKVVEINSNRNRGQSFVKSMPIWLDVAGSGKRPITINMRMDIHLKNETSSHFFRIGGQ